MLTVFFRYDDFSELSPRPVDCGVAEAFHRNALVCTFAVIPVVTSGSFRDPDRSDGIALSPTTASWLKTMRDVGCLEIALHGYHHRSERNSQPCSEFAGVPAEVQRHRLSSGKQMLEQITGQAVRVFVPPWNTYDATTVATLSGLGISCLSANRYGPALPVADLCYVPITIDLSQLRSAIEAQAACNAADVVIGVLLHPYDFRESGDPRAFLTIDDLDATLSWLASQPNVAVTAISSLAADQRRFDIQRYKANQPSRLETAYPPKLPRTESTVSYLPASTASRRKFANDLVAVAFYLLVSIASATLTGQLPPLLSPVTKGVVLVGLLLTLAAIVMRSIHRRVVFIKEAIAAATFLGCLIGLGYQ